MLVKVTPAHQIKNPKSQDLGFFIAYKLWPNNRHFRQNSLYKQQDNIYSAHKSQRCYRAILMLLIIILRRLKVGVLMRL
jgi:hypothetical protein